MAIPRGQPTVLFAAATALLVLWPAGAFSPPGFPPHDRSTASLAAAAGAAVAPPSPSAGVSPSSIAEAQAAAESAARSVHDNYAMNALFVNVPERPRPSPCAAALGGGSTPPPLPPDLPRGCLLRIGPNGAPKTEGFLDGDGFVHCVTLPPEGEGPPMHSSTFVTTAGRKLERGARIKRMRVKSGGAVRKARFGGGGGGSSSSEEPTFGGTLGAAPRGLPMLGNLVRNGLTFGTLTPQKDTCNTALAESGGRVLALMEQSPPSEISVGRDGRVRTVASAVRLNGAVPDAPINGGSLGAHGRTDPSSGERIHVSYNSAAQPYVRVDSFGDGWDLTKTSGVRVPSPVMVHDLAITDKYVVVLDFPLTIRPERLLRDSFPVEYEPQNGARIGLVPRDGSGDDTIWADVESGVVLHAANAYEREGDGAVVVHAFKSVPSGDSSYILDYTPAFLYEWVLDPSSGAVLSERCLNPDVMVEFPAVEDAEVGRRAEHCYGLVATSIGGPMLQFKTPEAGVVLDGVVKLSLHDDDRMGVRAGDVEGRYDLPKGWHFVSEPTVVKKTVGDGNYVLMVATFVPEEDTVDGRGHEEVGLDGTLMKSQLLILDGGIIGAGPVAAIDLPHQVNYGLHSLFLEWDKMQ